MLRPIRPGALTLAAVLSTLNATAQMAWGVKAGPNLTSLKVTYEAAGGTGLNNTAPPDLKATGGGWHAGVYFNTTGGSNAGLLFELMYSRRLASSSYDYTVSGSGVDYHYVGEVEYRLEYIELPLLLCVRPIERLSIHAGAAAALLRSATSKDRGQRSYPTGQGNIFTAGYSSNGTEKDLSKASVDLVVGGSVKVGTELLLSVRYLMDMNDLDPTSGTTAKSSLWQFSLCYEVTGARKQP